MPNINIDELCEPIKVTVGGVMYTIDDISQETAKRMDKLSKETADSTDISPLVGIMAEVLGAKREVISKLGMRKLLLLVTKVMGVINAEIEGKNVPGAAAKK